MGRGTNTMSASMKDLTHMINEQELRTNALRSQASMGASKRTEVAEETAEELQNHARVMQEIDLLKKSNAELSARMQQKTKALTDAESSLSKRQEQLKQLSQTIDDDKKHATQKKLDLIE